MNENEESMLEYNCLLFVQIYFIRRECIIIDTNISIFLARVKGLHFNALKRTKRGICHEVGKKITDDLLSRYPKWMSLDERPRFTIFSSSRGRIYGAGMGESLARPPARD